MPPGQLGRWGTIVVQRSLVTLLAAIGALFIILGGIIGFLLSFGPGGFGERFGGAAGALVYGALAVILGLLVLLFSGYTHYRAASHNLTGGVILLVLGIVTWVVVGGWILVALGSLLVVVAALIILAEVLLGQPRSSETRV